MKHTFTYFSNHISFIYFAQILQMGSNALYSTASIYYANDVIEEKDRMRGQTMTILIFCASGIIANLLGGILLDMFKIKTILLMNVMITLFGMIIAIVHMRFKPKRFMEEGYDARIS